MAEPSRYSHDVMMASSHSHLSGHFEACINCIQSCWATRLYDVPLVQHQSVNYQTGVVLRDQLEVPKTACLVVCRLFSNDSILSITTVGLHTSTLSYGT
jgi:hypothetical protein